MPDPYYPSVDYDFIEQNLLSCGKFQGHFKVGSTTTFVLNGSQAIYKRTVLVRELTTGQVSYEQSTGLAARYGFLGLLISWLEEHRDWKEGAYVEK